MYVLFPVPTRRAIELREEYAESGGFDAVKIRLRLPDGRIYDQTGKLDFINNAIAQDTDTITFRGVIPNPVLASQTAGGVNLRELIADEFVTVLLESVKPKQVIAVPRAAILSDQQGSYVYVVDDHNIARQRRVRLGQVTPETAGIADGLKEGEQVDRRRSAAGATQRAGDASARCLRRQRELTAMISSVFIDRPRLAIVIAIVIALGGLLALTRIPVAQLPDIVPPQVQVTAMYPGASAEVLEATVAQPLESKIVGVDKMIYMKSTSGNDGTYTLDVSFELGTNPDIDTVNVNNRVQTAIAQLPQEVQLQGMKVQKKSSSILQFVESL